MKFCILMGSPRKDGNTNALLSPFVEELGELGQEITSIPLYEKTLKPCVACRSCQADWNLFGCPILDDMQQIFDAALSADVIVLASPVYSWYCTPPMKAVLDRLVYGMNKYYGETKGPSLWAGKKLALVTTCGYPPERGSDLWEEGMKRYCKHSKLQYAGMLAQRHMGYQSVFMDEEKERLARSFAGELVLRCQEKEDTKS